MAKSRIVKDKELQERVQVLEKIVSGLQKSVGALDGQLKALRERLNGVESSSLKNGDSASLTCRSEFLTWMDSGAEVKSRPTSFIPNLQTWRLERRPPARRVPKRKK